MNSTLFPVILAAGRDVFRDMGSGFREKRETFEPTDLIPWVIVIVGLFVALTVLSWILARRDKSEHFNSPRALFRAIAKAHELDRGSRRLLWQLAREQGLAQQPARVFLEPDRFESAQLGAAIRSQHAALAALRAKLFAPERGE
jgi:hypothetical protein